MSNFDYMGFSKNTSSGFYTTIQNIKNKLNRTVYNYCGEINNGKIKVLQPRVIFNKKSNKCEVVLDSPAMVAACSALCLPKVIAKKYSCNMPNSAVQPLYDSAIKSQGFTLGKRTSICEYKIGHCAEQNACNELLKKDKKGKIKKMDEMYFSQAIRPKTRQVFNYCDNCKAIFPTLK